MFREKIFKWLANTVTRKTKTVLFACFLFTVFMVLGVTRMKMKIAFHEMLPKKYPEVQAFHDIMNDFGTTASDFIVIESKIKDVEQMKKCADILAEKIVNLTLIEAIKEKNKEEKSEIRYDTTSLIKRIEYEIDREFIKKYGFIIQKEKDLKSIIDMYSAMDIAGLLENINNNFEKEYIEAEENLSSFDGEQRAIYGLDGINRYLHGLKEYLHTKDSLRLKNSVEKFLNGPEYILSPDNSLLIMKTVPEDEDGESDVYKTAMAIANGIKGIIAEVNKDFPELYIGATGPTILGSDVIESTKKDFGLPNVIAFLLILVLLIGSFGSWKSPFLAVVTLIIALLWASGFIAITIQYLNVLSVAFGIILIGLGIDYGIHFISGFRDARLLGLSLEESINHMYQKYGTGVATGAFTTAFAFLALSFTDFQVLTETGIACGAGILFCMLAMMILLPALIVWNNKGYSVIGNSFRKLGLNFIPDIYLKIIVFIGAVFSKIFLKTTESAFRFTFLEKAGHYINKTSVAIGILICALIISVVSISFIKSIGFEYNMMDLEEEGIMSAVNQDKILDKFEMSPDFTMILASDIKDCREKVKQLKNIADRTDLIGRIDALTEFLPDENRQKENLIKLEEFKKYIENQETNTPVTEKTIQKIKKELKRLHNNIVEIGELSITANGENNKLLKKCDEIVGEKDTESFILKFAEELKDNKNYLSKISACQIISAKEIKRNLLEKCPDNIVTIDNLPEDIRKRYVNKNNNNLLITVYSKEQIYDGRVLKRFNKQIKKVSEAATGSPILIFLFLRLIVEKGRAATIFAAFAIIILLLIDFRSFVYTILAMVPLLIGASWMFGAMALFGVTFSMSNIIVFPLILGIGIDDAVHILHRYKIEGRGNIPKVLRYTGRAVLLTSLTTVIAFGVMAFGCRRGIASAGLVLAFGVSFCFITSVFVLPALICLYEKIVRK